MRARWRREIAEAEAENRRLERMEKQAPRAWALSARIDEATSLCRRRNYPDQVLILENLSLGIWWFCDQGKEITPAVEAEATKRVAYAEWLCAGDPTGSAHA